MKRRYTTRVLAAATLLLFIGAGVGLVAFQAQDGRFLSVQTGSMEPHIPKGSLVAVTKISSDRLVPGDVVTFTNPADRRQTITHRIIGTQPSPIAGAKPRFITKGDANPGPDAPVLGKSVVGKVGFSVPYMGFALDFIRKPAGLLLAIYVPALTVIVAEIRRLIAYYKSQEPYVLPELLARRQRKSGRTAKMALPVFATVVALGGVVAVPAQAALQSSVVLTGNTITAAQAVPPDPDPHPHRRGVRIKKVFFGRPRRHRPAKLYIVLYNSSRRPVNISGWKLKSGRKTLHTFPAHTRIWPKDRHMVKIWRHDLSHKFGKLILYNAAGERVDQESWGRRVHYSR